MATCPSHLTWPACIVISLKLWFTVLVVYQNHLVAFKNYQCLNTIHGASDLIDLAFIFKASKMILVCSPC